MGKGSEQTFLRRTQIASRDMKTMLSITAIQTAMSYHLTPVRMAFIKKTKTSKCW